MSRGLNSAVPCNKQCFLFFLFLCFSHLALTISLRNAQPKTISQGGTLPGALKFLGITVHRDIRVPTVSATPEVDPDNPSQIALSKDINIRKVRLYKPIKIEKKYSNTKLPLIIYAHGGEFVSYSNATQYFHEFCNKISSIFPAIVASVEYHLAPEHPLPAAYFDFEDVINWVEDQAGDEPADRRDPWLVNVDFKRVFLMGTSAGGNIVYHAAIRALNNWSYERIKIAGILMNQPYFGGVKRTASEEALKNDKVFPLYKNDVAWLLALPLGEDRDHSFANGKKYEEDIVKRLPRVYIRGNCGDPLVDREISLAEFLCSKGVHVVKDFVEGGSHAIEIRDSKAANVVYEAMKRFVTSTGTADDCAPTTHCAPSPVPVPAPAPTPTTTTIPLASY